MTDISGMNGDGEYVVTGKRRPTIDQHHPIVTLKVNGQIHGGWKSEDIQRSIEDIAGGFSLTMTDYDPSVSRIVQIAPGDPCELAVDGETVISGYVDDSEIEFEADTHEVHITGRDKTGDLVDCPGYIPDMLPAVWADGASPLTIVSQIAKPFGITVKSEISLNSVTLFMLQPGETAFTAIDRLAKEAAFLPVSDGQGGIVLTRGGLGSVFSPLDEGLNILSARGGSSWRDRFSRYYVFTESAGEYVTSTPEPERFAYADDPVVTRWRPSFLVADFQQPTAADIQARADWEATVHAARAIRYVVTVQGWQDDTGLLWQPNGTVKVTSASLGVDETLLVVSVRLIEDEKGTRTELGLTRPDAFKLIPLAAQPDFIDLKSGPASGATP